MHNGFALQSPRHAKKQVRRDVEAGIPYSTAGKSVVWDEGRRLLVPNDGAGKLMIIESRHAEV